MLGIEKELQRIEMGKSERRRGLLPHPFPYHIIRDL
jgi:hypothetical protein